MTSVSDEAYTLREELAKIATRYGDWCMDWPPREWNPNPLEVCVAIRDELTALLTLPHLTDDGVGSGEPAVAAGETGSIPAGNPAPSSPHPTTPVADKQAIVAALKDHEFVARGGPGAEVFGCRCGVEFEEPGYDGYWEDPLHLHFADVLSAAGVFREGATPAIDREALLGMVQRYREYHTNSLLGLTDYGQGRRETFGQAADDLEKILGGDA